MLVKGIKVLLMKKEDKEQGHRDKHNVSENEKQKLVEYRRNYYTTLKK